MQFHFPETFIKTIHERYGEKGEKWLNELPGIIQQCIDQWNLTLEANEYELYYNYVTPVQMPGGQKAILKVGFPSEKEVMTEVKALSYFPEKYSVQVLARDDELRACVLEKLNPGTSLREVHVEDDAKATEIALPLLREIPVSIPKKHSFPSIADWAEVISKTKMISIKGDIANDILDTAQGIFEELETSATEQKLLHGDLHHDNILYDEQRGWIAIDPKGLIGDPAYNAARFIINNWSNIAHEELADSRIATIATALGYNSQRIAGWAYVDYIISNCWMLEEGDESKIDLSYAKKLESLYEI